MVPRAASVYAVALDLRPALRAGERAGVDLAPIDALACDGAISRVAVGCKMQARPSAIALSRPIRLFDFDFAADDLDLSELDAADGDMLRRCERECEIVRSGVLTCFAVYFELELVEGMTFSSGPADAGKDAAWDQLLKYMPAQVPVTRGERLPIVATHTEADVSIALAPGALPTAAMRRDDIIGHTAWHGRDGKLVTTRMLAEWCVD